MMKAQLIRNLLIFWMIVQYSEAAGNLNISCNSQGWFVSLKGPHNSIGIRSSHKQNIRKASCPQFSAGSFKLRVNAANPQIKSVDVGFSTVSCFEFDSLNQDSKTPTCVGLGNDYWYGGTELRVQRWPIQNLDLPRVPYITGDFGHDPLGGIMEGLWISSSGFIVYVDRATPLFLSFNQTGDSQICFSSSYDEYPYNGVSPAVRSKKLLKFTVCTSDNVREAYQFAYSRWLRKPMGVVDPSVITRPIWSTWARYKKDVNQETVIKFANEIVLNGFKGSHLELDDMWETCYGELMFDQKKFPNVSDMVEQITSMGFNVSLWIHPYTNIPCPSFIDPAVRPLFIKDAISGEPLICSWWNGLGGYLDFTNPKAIEYFVRKVVKIKKSTGIQAFKFDSGEVGYIKKNFKFADNNLMATPNEFTRNYVDTAAMFGTGVEVRVAYNSQHLPIFVRMLDKDSRWDYTNGLQTLIPTALLMSTIGYPFILPDMIGGSNAFPDKELFVRWLQVNVFMPSLQFSIVPWDYDQEVVNISLAMVALHERYAPLINQLAQEASETGNPIVRPLWWIAPKDPDAQLAEQQYLLGDDILVAPVVEKGATSRDIYIPPGSWEDQLSPGITHEGPIWLVGYSAQLHQLPYFLRKIIE